MKLQLNGETQEVNDAATLDELVTRLGIERQHLVIEHNGAIRTAEEWSAAALQDGDVVEMVRFVGGG
ncbi:MAG: sulfur carrier protein [Candidatus Sumerlaeota bacterium]|nr:sulfur carrier protein [Candidatus Sumerlaeota bacterium]